MDAPGSKEAAVLVPLYTFDGELHAVFTERRDDMRKHAGEISFPGGRQDEPDEDLRQTALREAEEEIGLDPGVVELVGALPPVGTFVTGYRVYPFVGHHPRRAHLAAPGERGGPGARAVAARPGARLREQAAAAPRRPDQDAHLHGRRPFRLGRHGAHGRSRCCSGWSRSCCTG